MRAIFSPFYAVTVTGTVVVCVVPPLDHVTVIVALPTATAVTVDPLTVATPVLLDVLEVTVAPLGRLSDREGLLESESVCVASVWFDAAACACFS